MIRRFAFSAFGVAMALSASANVFSNSQFNAGFSAWSVINTPNGVGAPGMVDPWDMDGPGPAPATPAAHFVAGRDAPGPGLGGVILAQSVNLVAGEEYMISFHASAACAISNPDAGRFELLINNLTRAQWEPGFLAGGQPKFGFVSFGFVAPVSGPYVIGARVVRGVVPEPVTPVNQFVDNFISLQRTPSLVEQIHVLDGEYADGNLDSLLTVDQDRLSIFDNAERLAAAVEFVGHAPAGVPGEIAFVMASDVDRPGIIQETALFNFAQNHFVTFDGKLMPRNEVGTEVHVTTRPGDYVGPQGLLRARVVWHLVQDEAPSVDGWLHNVNLARWVVTQ